MLNVEHEDLNLEYEKIARTTGIKTQAGIEMFKYFNDRYGSSIWGRVMDGIKAIEEELK